MRVDISVKSDREIPSGERCNRCYFTRQVDESEAAAQAYLWWKLEVAG